MTAAKKTTSTEKKNSGVVYMALNVDYETSFGDTAKEAADDMYTNTGVSASIVLELPRSIFEPVIPRIISIK